MPVLARWPGRPPGVAARVASGRAISCATGMTIVAILAVLSIPTASSSATARSPVTQEYDLKAAFLFNFARFVEWPADAFAAATTPIVIGVLGNDPFGASLDTLVAGETVRNRPLLVRRYRSVESVDACHVLFISASEAGQLDHIARVIGRRSILTVGETKDFAARAGIVGFELAQRRLRLRINLAAATDARLTISSKLLRQAQIVRSSGRRD
jgi:uncharacterized protein DUF4154